MSTDTDLHPLAQNYLKRLKRVARPLPRDVRNELLADIDAHLRESTAPTMSDVEVLNEIDRLGDPNEIVAQAAGEDGAAPVGKRGLHEWAAVLLLAFGGFFFFFGWLIGVVLLWTSSRWTTRDRLIGTLLPPFGTASVFLSLGIGLGTSDSSGTCSGTATPIGTSGTILSATPTGGQATIASTTAMHCTSSGGSPSLEQIIFVAIFVILAVASVVTPVYLARRANRPVID